MGKHVIKSWSLTQSVIALSSGETEYYGLVKGASLAMGTRSFIADLGIDMGIRVRTDSTAAKGIASRTGLGKVRHIEVAQLWVQEKIRNGDIVLEKLTVRPIFPIALPSTSPGKILSGKCHKRGR